MLRFLIPLLLLSIWACAEQPQPEPEAVSPYTTMGNRDIKALSEEEVVGYLSGDGLSLALAAELNSYPGPKHVLELSDSLDLTSEQQSIVLEAYNMMQTEAASLGADFVEAERALDRLFAADSATAEDVERIAEAAGRLQSRIRAAHLRAHVATRDALSPEQLERYNRLRGYGGHHPRHLHDN